MFSYMNVMGVFMSCKGLAGRASRAQQVGAVESEVERGITML